MIRSPSAARRFPSICPESALGTAAFYASVARCQDAFGDGSAQVALAGQASPVGLFPRIW
jgi:hypothetical protein